MAAADDQRVPFLVLQRARCGCAAAAAAAAKAPSPHSLRRIVLSGSSGRECFIYLICVLSSLINDFKFRE